VRSKQALKLIIHIVFIAVTLLLVGAGKAAADDAWLVRLNHYRTMAGLSPFEPENRMTAGANDFARYLVNQDSAATCAGKPLTVKDYTEGVNIWWFDYEDFVAGRTSNALVTTNALTPVNAIDNWIADSMNRLPLLVPEPPPVRVAYGDFCVKRVCSAILYSSDRSLSLDLRVIGYEFPLKYQVPVIFPPANSTIDIVSLGHQSPDLSHTYPFKAPTGLPLTLQFGRWISPRITSGSIRTNGKAVQACAIDSTNYLNSDVFMENRVRHTLDQFGAIVIVPRFPLRPSTKYSVHAVVSDRGSYDWSFSTSAKAIAMP